MRRWVWLGTAMAMTLAGTEVGAAENAVRGQDGGFLLLALLALIPLRMAIKIIPEWIRSFEHRPEGRAEAAGLAESEGSGR